MPKMGMFLCHKLYLKKAIERKERKKNRKKERLSHKKVWTKKSYL